MSEFALTLVANFGVPVLFGVTFLSCLALPVPSSLLMLASGGFAATGDLSLMAVVSAAYTGAVLGDNSGYWIARSSGNRIGDWLDRNPKRAAMRQKGQAFMHRRGGGTVFFSCWLVAPLGPYINYVSGLTHFHWPHFVLWGLAGEVVWVGLYVGLGYSFADNITNVANVFGNTSGLITTASVAIALGWWLWDSSHQKNA